MGCPNENPNPPRNGHTYVVGIVARISGCANQQEVSLDDQVDHGKEVALEVFPGGPFDFRVIATKGKGESLERPELAEIEAMLRSRELDLLVAEDLGRWVRGVEAVRLCGIAVDHDTRVIAPNDCIDTAEATWEEDAISACRDHVGHNAHTSKRLKFKLMNRFVKYGGATALEIAGYLKPPGAKTYEEWTRDPAAIPVYAEWFRRLRHDRNCSALADWLNHKQFPTGKYTRATVWTPAMVRRVTANPILKGLVRRGVKHTVKHFETGKRVATVNPKGPKFRHYPHLAFVAEGEFDDVNQMIRDANANYRRKPVQGDDPLRRVPRKRTTFPGQHACCHYCGRQYVWGGNGQPERLMCTGSHAKQCWNTISFSGALAADRITALIAEQLTQLDGFEAQYRALVEEARREVGGDQSRERGELEQAETEAARQRGNLTAAIAEYGPQPALKEKLTELETTLRALAGRRRELDRRRVRVPDLPDSPAALRAMMEDQFRHLARDSPEFGDLMRQIVPQFQVHVVRLCDGGHLQPRARITLDLGGLVPDSQHAPQLKRMLTRAVTLDLFEPAQRETIRADAVRLHAEGLKQREIAQRLPQKPTQTAVGRTLALDRVMRQRGLDSPYEIILEPPPDYTKLRNPQHPRYRFTPLDGYAPPPL